MDAIFRQFSKVIESAKAMETADLRYLIARLQAILDAKEKA